MSYELHTLDHEPDFYAPLESLGFDYELEELVTLDYGVLDYTEPVDPDVDDLDEPLVEEDDIGVANSFGAIRIFDDSSMVFNSIGAGFGDFSLVFWIKPVGSGGRTAISLPFDSDSIDITFDSDGEEYTPRIFFNGNISEGPPLSVDNWHGFVVVKNGSNFDWYIDENDPVDYGFSTVGQGTWSNPEDEVEYIIQHVTFFDRVLVGQEARDILSMGLNSLIVRQVEIDDDIQIQDGVTTGLQTDWHIIGA